MTYLHRFYTILKMKKDKKLLNIGEAAKILGISIDTLRRWDAKGKLKAAKSPGGHRYYLKEQLSGFMSKPEEIANIWVKNQTESEPPSDYYCQTQDVFKNRLNRMALEISRNSSIEKLASWIVAIVGEIGNNSFDHNFGNWPDVPGIFFVYNENKRFVILADRGVGIRATLSRVRPDLKDDMSALKVAFTERISGRAPEQRGNGLKFVNNIATENPIGVSLQSGIAVADIAKKNGSLKINTVDDCIRGTLTKIIY